MWQAEPGLSLLTTGVYVRPDSVKTMRGGADVKFHVHDGKGNVFLCIGWGMGRWAEQMSPQLDIIYRIEPDTWRERDTLRLNLVALKAHSDEDGS